MSPLLRKRLMDWLMPFLVLGIWLILSIWVLPKLGFPT